MSMPFKTTVFIVLSLGVTSCAPLSLYYKPGVEVARMQSDTLSCEVKALKDAPVANELRQRPPIYFPGSQICNGTNCFFRPGYYVDGAFYTVDLNQGLRQRVEQNCMAQKGYQPLQLKQCSQSVATAAGGGQTTRLPQITETSCAIRNKDGSFRIVSTG